MTRHTDGLAMTCSRTNHGPKPPPGGGHRRWLACVTAILLASSDVGQSQPATQPTDQGDSPTQKSSASLVLKGENGNLWATIQVGEVAREPVVIPVGTSTVLDVNAPVRRVEVATPEVAELKVLSPRQILMTGQEAGTTQVILWDENDRRLVFAVQVEPNLTQLKEAIRRTAPDAEVEFRVVRGVLILSGRVSNTDDARRITEIASIICPKLQNHLTVVGQQQVLLRCTVAEVSRSAVRQLGVDAWASFEENAPRITANQLAGVDTSLIGPTAGMPGAGGTAFFGNRFLFGSDAGGFQITQSSQSLQMQLFVRAMQDNGLLKVLAEPNLVAMSGQKASFLAGGEFPVPVPQERNITIEWKRYGVRLEFVPTVIGQQMIRLSVAPEISEIDYSNAVQLEGYVVPGVTQRQAMTTIELPGGSTIAIAGLLSEQLRGSISKIPGLGDIPVLGALFRSLDYRRNLTELVILVTPELVTCMYPDQVPAVPGQQDVTVPNDWELYGLGMLEGKPIPEDPSRRTALRTEIKPHYRKFAGPPGQMSLHGPWGVAEPSETVE